MSLRSFNKETLISSYIEYVTSLRTAVMYESIENWEVKNDRDFS